MVSIKSTPHCDCDMLEFLVSSTYLKGCDKVEIISDVANFLAINFMQKSDFVV
jgi:hypothetical protein